MFKPCIIIPVFNHGQTIVKTVLSIEIVPIIIVNDGSDEACTAVLYQLAQQNQQVNLVEHKINRGKGAAFKTGLRMALNLGYSHALQVDADGQHDTGDIPRFIETAREFPQAIINGNPVYDNSMPKHRYYGRYLTHIWVWINTLSLDISDSMCGFRLYPVASTQSVIDKSFIGNRMDFDTEILVRCYWRGIEIKAINTRVIYPADGVSHFCAVKDNVRISLMHMRLFFGMLARIPLLMMRKLNKVS